MKTTDDRVPIETLPIGSEIRIRLEGITWVIERIDNNEVLIRGNKQYKYVTGNTRVFTVEKTMI